MSRTLSPDTAELRRLHEASELLSPLPWVDDIGKITDANWEGIFIAVEADDNSDAKLDYFEDDGKLVVAIRNALPSILDRLELLEKALKQAAGLLCIETGYRANNGDWDIVYPERIVCHEGIDGRLNCDDAPELAQYLREKESATNG